MLTARPPPLSLLACAPPPQVPPQSVEETAAVMESLLVLPEARSAEANMIVRALHPIPADPEQLGAIPQMPAEPVAAVPAVELLATETATSAIEVTPSATETAAAAGPEAGPGQVPVMESTAVGLAASTAADPADGLVSAAHTGCVSRAGTIREQIFATTPGIVGFGSY